MFESLHASQPGPTLEFGLPPSSLFKFPPNPRPAPLPAPQTERSWTQPFPIPPELYLKLLDVRVPVTIASVYATTVIILNRVNKRRGYKPWAFSRTRLFKAFVILHNVFLAVYSAWTFAGMVRTFRNSMPSRDDPNRIVAVTDALCKILGPRGLGNGAMYNSTTDEWVLPNPEYKLTAGGVPDPADDGRLWNQGLAYFGWIFYLSKFYEVLDTAIILAKGKKSSTLQTYHHAGAMMCMWAGIRYMGPPIWIFALVNSGIHALMYTYYTITALSIRVPTQFKRMLTTLQITQFVFGSMLAAAHLFVRYSIPVTVPQVLPTAVPSAVSAAESGIAAATATAGLMPWLKKLAFRAAGAEGIAANVLNAQGQHFGADAVNAAQFSQAKNMADNAVRYEMINCIDTTGHAYGILLNVMYLLPLTYLFARFFVRSYLHRKEPAVKHPTQMHIAEQAGLDALKGVSREIQKAVMEMHGDGDTSATEDEALTQKAKAEAAQQKLDEANGKATSKLSDKTGRDAADEDAGFSTVPARLRAKKKDVEKSAALPTSNVEASNRFGALKDEISEGNGKSS
ncbi:hypothetical protein VTN96DRAFT_7311 [Rasamsonia emersonii]|uniref:Elongation of fatty acids protein n=1 Tax=Rasamsonia emersonii (strain ATCC 16479 / CBS 393.64 / IMI 116815) TaxID=1408163 RepID=A0A0F4Z2E5_RASE3|nr:Fatty acid elongase (Gig30) [Rasamsonia emersonii CBS 393.64]KKA24679.1 Fatty acid elongase (Gig30) [Rasamsonia emersonii CBS 393.64]